MSRLHLVVTTRQDVGDAVLVLARGRPISYGTGDSYSTTHVHAIAMDALNDATGYRVHEGSGGSSPGELLGTVRLVSDEALTDEQRHALARARRLAKALRCNTAQALAIIAGDAPADRGHHDTA
jgi:hypothetical protein